MYSRPVDGALPSCCYSAVKVVMLKTKRKSSKRVVQLNIQQIFKQSSVPINVAAKIDFWTNSSNKCVCPKMKKGRTYLVCGYEDTVKDRLLLSSKSMVGEWTAQLEEDVPSWLNRATTRSKTPSPGNTVPQKPPKPKKIGKNGRPYRIRYLT